MEIAYPLFKLGIRKPETIDGVMFYLNQYENDGEDPSTRIKIIDDRNEPGATLALRRLKLKVANIDLFKINKAIYFVGDLIKLATPHTWFIDSNGRLFNYLKTSKAKLVIILIFIGTIYFKLILNLYIIIWNFYPKLCTLKFLC